MNDKARIRTTICVTIELIRWNAYLENGIIIGINYEDPITGNVHQKLLHNDPITDIRSQKSIYRIKNSRLLAEAINQI